MTSSRAYARGRMSAANPISSEDERSAKSPIRDRSSGSARTVGLTGRRTPPRVDSLCMPGLVIGALLQVPAAYDTSHPMATRVLAVHWSLHFSTGLQRVVVGTARRPVVLTRWSDRLIFELRLHIR